MPALRSYEALLAYLTGIIERAGVKARSDASDLTLDGGPLEVWHSLAESHGLRLGELARLVAHHCKTELADVSDVPQRVIKLVPEQLARRHRVLPVREEDRHLDVATSDPTDFDAEHALEFASGRSVRFLIAPPDELEEAIEHYYTPEKAVQTFVERLSPLMSGEFTIIETQENDTAEAPEADSAPVIQLTNLILRDAIQQEASDIHLEPGKGGGGVRFRVDGVLRHHMRLPMAAMTRVSSRIKILAKMDIADRLRPQDGRAAIIANGVTYDLRVSTVPTRDGEKIVVRILNPGSTVGLDDLHMTGPELSRFRSLLLHRDGLILVTGPTGSGKTTTLYAGIRELSTGEQNIMTVEDPVEYELESVNQIQIEPKKGVTFASALRAILRQDPDVIFVGEIRDAETAEIAVQACMTGHLVLATLHTNDALGGIKRLADLGVDSASIAATLRGAVAQRLVRHVCADCREEVSDKLTAKEEALVERNGVRPRVRAVGCKNCGDSGYRGRYPVSEVVTMTPDLQTLIAKDASHLELIREAERCGFRSVEKSVVDHIESGVTTLEEVERVIGRIHGGEDVHDVSGRPTTGDVSDEASSVAETKAGSVRQRIRPRAKTTRVRKRTKKASGKSPKRAKKKRTLPSREQAPVEAVGDKPEHDAPGLEEGINILLVEDDPVTRKQAKRLLVSRGYHVTEAVDGEHAMSRLDKQTDFGLMVLDLFMPKLDGRGVLAKVRAESATAALPVVVLTSATDPDTEIELMDSGADDYIRKPLDPPYFNARVNGVLRRAGLV